MSNSSTALIPAEASLNLADLARANQPAQLPMVTKVAGALSASATVTHLLVRGSLASGTADRLSDLDFVVGIHDAFLPEFTAALDALMTIKAGAILPGWRDSIVADLGGLGFVFLVPHDGKLQQIDLYLAPASEIPRIRRTVRTTNLLDRGDPETGAESAARAAVFVAEQHARTKSCTELLIEHLVLAVLLHKRIRRGQRFVAYAEWHLMHNATKDLIKAALAPASTFWGWYQLREEIAVTPIGRACLADLDKAISGPAVPGTSNVNAALDRVLALTERACPYALDGLTDAIAAYRTYLELT